MTQTIFCPSNHLILDATHCPKCGWERPVNRETGQEAWCPKELGAGLGGPGRHVFAQPAAVRGVAAFPLNNREIVGVSLSDGNVTWRSPLETGLVTRTIVTDGKRLLSCLSDERSIGQAEAGKLVAFDAFSGEMSTLWQADGHQLSPPVVSDQIILIRCSGSGLLAFQSTAKCELAWKASLDTWWALEPFVAGGKVIVADGAAMLGVGKLKAFDLATGKLAWQQDTDGMLKYVPCMLSDTLIYQDGRKRIQALDLVTGQKLWSLEIGQLYTPPLAGEELVYFCRRGTAAKEEPGYYLLQAIEPTSGQERWQAHLPGRVLIPPLCSGSTIYLASEDGRLLAYKDSDGSPLFEQVITDDENPPRSELLLADGLLLAGTYSGRLHALRVSMPSEQPGSPQAHLDCGEFEAAAAAYANKGNFRKAAELYIEPLKDIDKALQLYEHGNLFAEAAKLASAQGLHSQAAGYFELAGNRKKQAQSVLDSGDDLGAAQLYEEIGENKIAAPLFEKAGDLAHALDLYSRLKSLGDITRLSGQVPISLEIIQLLEESGEFEQAARIALENGYLRKAVDLFKRADKPEETLAAMIKLVQKEPEDWVWQELTELARKAGNFNQEALAWEKLGRAEKSADAYQRAAQQMIIVSPGNEIGIADLFRKAEKLFDDAGELHRLQECHKNVIQYGRLPEIIVQGRPREIFEQGQWNILDLKVRNVGNGIARNLVVSVGGDQFAVDTIKGTWHRHALGVGIETRFEIHILHRPERSAGMVPLKLQWEWQDEHGQSYDDFISTSVQVRTRGETPSHATPAEIHYHGTVYQTEKGDILGSGDKLMDDAEKQVGDKVVINRQGVHLSTEGETLPPERHCPKCFMSIEADAKMCIYCGNDLPSPARRRTSK